MAMLAVSMYGQRPAHIPPSLRLGLQRPREFSLSRLDATERALLAQPDIRKRAGVHRALPATALTSGQWETAADGTRLWRLAVRSPGSTGIRLELRDFNLGAGRLWLYSGNQVAGPYTGRGTFNNGHFWTETIFSESATLDYEPADANATGLPFEIRTLSHQTVTLSAASSASTLDPATDASTTKDPADYCHLDPNCYSDWQDSMKMVAQLSFESDGSSYLCSGALVATRDNSRKPYLLTAGHCIDSEEAARTLQVYWTYQTTGCGGTVPESRSTSTKSSLGANLIGWSTISAGDYSLVLLKDVPSGVLFANWDMTDPPEGTALTGIHHPAGSWKRISFGVRSTDETVEVEDTTAPGSLFLNILWTKGRVESGSSGSPLFSAPGVIVGSLTYGLESSTVGVCSIDPDYAGYGRFSNVYTNLKDYFENLPSAEVLPATAGVEFSVVNGVSSTARQNVQLTTKSTGETAYKLRADASWIKLSTTSGTVSATSPATVAIGIDPTKFDRADKYQSTVAILTGAADPQYIDVAATVAVDRSKVAATVTPISGTAESSFRLRLQETAGLATRVTTVKVNGVDYSPSLSDWFGTTLIPAKGTLEAQLSANFIFSSGLQFFEFRGTDETTGRKWYITATATF
jgi:hypothetical protein